MVAGLSTLAERYCYRPGVTRRLVAVSGGVARELRELEGPADQTAPYYACADAFLLPTEYEAFSLVTLEAAASGLPLLVPRVNGMDEILVEGRNGWFIDRDGDMIATRLEALRRDEELRVGMGQRAREDSAGFTFASTKI